MSKFNFCGPSYSSQSLNADAQSTVNWYPEQIESGDGNTNLALYPTPGLKKFADLSPSVPTSGLQNVRVTITPTQLRASGVTPIQLLPAQGANLVIIALSAVFQYRFVTTSYTEIVPLIGLGTTVADVQASFNIQPQLSVFSQTVDSIEVSGSLASWNNLPPAKFANQPLLWADQDDPSTDPGDGNVIVNIMYYVLNISTGAIVGGSGKVHFSMTQISTAQLKAAHATPVSLITAPGANLAIVPLSLVVWHHFNSAPLSTIPLPIAGYGSTYSAVLLTQTFQSLDSDAFRLSADSMEQDFSTYNPKISYITDAQLIDQPFSWANTADVSLATGDPTVTVYMQYLVINPSTGEYIQGSGTLFNTITQVSSASIKAGSTVAKTMAPAPGANLLIVEEFATAQCTFVSSSYGDVSPSPSISPAATVANEVKLSLLPLSSAGGGFTLWESASTQLFLEPATFYQAASTMAGSEIAPASVINQPASWGDTVDCSGSSGNSTATINLSYLILNTSTGVLS